jgi:formate hydrogenlyase transcriptional activator
MRSGGFVGTSSASRRVLALVELVAPSEATVLLQGETGTGKEIVARMIHRNSRRAAGPFITVNCAALPDSLVESELFGYRRGSFTGADSDRQGLFAAAAEGTLFLDEVGDMPLILQPKLLRALEERTFLPLGGREQVLDARIIAATNKSLEAAITCGAFRADLYYRLCVAAIRLPALRERPDDIAALAQHFGGDTQIPPAVLDVLKGYHWPGNVRELRNFIERMKLFHNGTEILADDVKQLIPKRHVTRGGLTEELRHFEKERILDALAASKSGIAGAATQLAMKRTTLSARMRTLGIA